LAGVELLSKLVEADDVFLVLLLELVDEVCPFLYTFLMVAHLGSQQLNLFLIVLSGVVICLLYVLLSFDISFS
jgi:hypothetical protein